MCTKAVIKITVWQYVYRLRDGCFGSGTSEYLLELLLRFSILDAPLKACNSKPDVHHGSFVYFFNRYEYYRSALHVAEQRLSC